MQDRHTSSTCYYWSKTAQPTQNHCISDLRMKYEYSSQSRLKPAMILCYPLLAVIETLLNLVNGLLK